MTEKPNSENESSAFSIASMGGLSTDTAAVIAERVCRATPQFEPDLRRNFSYPSGHTILGWTSALLLTEINPERADTILKRGMMYGESRVIVGAHWQSDVDAGRLAAAAVYSRMHTSERFLEQMQLARQEFRIKAGLATIIEMKAYKKAAESPPRSRRTVRMVTCRTRRPELAI